MLLLSKHVFGAYHGYGTLAASSDVTQQERRELEVFSFGQTSDGSYLQSLSRMPAYCSRLLSTGRRVLTRVFQGPPDDNNRATLLFVTALMDARDWQIHVRGNERRLLENGDLWQWNGEAELPPLRMDSPTGSHGAIPKDQRSRILSLIALIEQTDLNANTTILVPAQDVAPIDMDLILGLLPRDEARRFGYAVRSLSDGLAVHLNALDPRAVRGRGSRRLVDGESETQTRGRYTSTLAELWKPHGPPPLDFADARSRFGDLPAEVGADGAALSPPVTGRPVVAARARRMPRWFTLPLTGIVLTSLLVGVTGFLLWRRMHIQHERTSCVQAVQDFLTDHSVTQSVTGPVCADGELLEQAARLAERLTKLTSAGADADGVAEVSQHLESWRREAAERCDAIKTVEQVLSDLNVFAESLGLADPEAVESYPDPETIRNVNEWRRKVEETRTPADELGEPYVSEVAIAMDRFARWEKRVAALPAIAKEQLEAIRSWLAETKVPPLSTQLLEEWDATQEQFVLSQRRLPTIDASTNGLSSGLLELVESVGHEMTQLAKQIDSLQQLVSEQLTIAEAKIVAHELNKPVSVIGQVDERIDRIADVQASLSPILQTWPDCPRAIEIRKSLDAWTLAAGRVVLLELRKRVEAAEAYDQDSQSGDSGATEAEKAKMQDAIAEAHALWKQYFGSLLDLDEVRNEATRLLERIIQLEKKYSPESDEGPKAAEQVQ